MRRFNVRSLPLASGVLTGLVAIGSLAGMPFVRGQQFGLTPPSHVEQFAAQAGNPARPSLGEALDAWVSRTEELVVPAAEAMPEEKYSFTPAIGRSAGEFGGVRTFAEKVSHLAAANYQLGALVLGEKPPHSEHGERAPDSVGTRAEILEYLRDSFAYLHRAAKRLNETNATEVVELSGGKLRDTRVGLLVDALTHSQNHYGQMVEYLRMNRIVPPASR